METSLDQILRQRETQGERTVALLRVCFVSITTLLDALAYAGIIPPYTASAPTAVTIALDSFFLGIAAVFAGLAIKGVYRSFFKFITITLDYLLVIVMFSFDPSIASGGHENLWLAVIAPVFMFYLNLIRFSRSAAWFGAILSVLLCAALGRIVHGGWNLENILPLEFGMTMLLAIGLFINSAGTKMMQQANAKIMLERYLPPQLVDELGRSEASLLPGGRRQTVTMLFADIRGFTRISESMAPEQVVDLLNDYLSAMTDVIFRHEGTIDKFIGDAVMTIFGAPVSRKDDVVRACDAAREMILALHDFNARHPELPSPLQIGIGLHTGEVVAGNIGSAKRLDYTVIGDHVNLTSRIESLTKYYGCRILVSSAVVEGLRACGVEPLVREIDTVVVQGRTQRVVVFELLVSGV